MDIKGQKKKESSPQWEFQTHNLPDTGRTH